jgi:hypothetical protein
MRPQNLKPDLGPKCTRWRTSAVPSCRMRGSSACAMRSSTAAVMVCSLRSRMAGFRVYTVCGRSLDHARVMSAHIPSRSTLADSSTALGPQASRPDRCRPVACRTPARTWVHPVLLQVRRAHSAHITAEQLQMQGFHSQLWRAPHRWGSGECFCVTARCPIDCTHKLLQMQVLCATSEWKVQQLQTQMK